MRAASDGYYLCTTRVDAEPEQGIKNDINVVSENDAYKKSD